MPERSKILVITITKTASAEEKKRKAFDFYPVQIEFFTLHNPNPNADREEILDGWMKSMEASGISSTRAIKRL